MLNLDVLQALPDHRDGTGSRRQKLAQSHRTGVSEAHSAQDPSGLRRAVNTPKESP